MKIAALFTYSSNGGFPPELMVQRIMQSIWKKQIWCRDRQKGFSLIELMIVIGIAAVIAAIGIPGFLSMRERYKLRESATDVMSAVKRAQSEAVKRGTSVVLTPDAVAGTCTVFIDNAGGTPNVCDVGETVVLPVGSTVAACSPLITVQPGNALATSFVNTVFNSRGLPSTTGAITVIRAGSNVQYQISLNVTGRVNLQVSTDSGATFH